MAGGIEHSFLIIDLLIVGLLFTGILVTGYWQSQEWTWSKINDLSERTAVKRVLASVLLAAWMIGLFLCGAPVIVISALAICA